MIDMDKEFLLLKPQGRCNKTFIKKNFPEEYEKVLLRSGNTFSEKLYNYLFDNPLHICPVCGKETPFRTITYGYSEYCSIKCSYKSDSRIEKYKKTCLEKYGVENVSKNDNIKQKKKETITRNYGGVGFASKEISNKSKLTVIERYGVENVSKNDNIKQKKKETVTRNYGGVGFASKTIKEKASQTLFKNHGVTNPYQIGRVKENAHKKYYEKFYKENPLVKSIDHDTLTYTCYCTHINSCNKCNEKEFQISNIGYNNRKYANCELCTKLVPENTNNYKNTTLELFIQDLLTKYDIKFETSVRSTIYPYELDTYIPSKNIAIECNGIYWHSDQNKPKEYHYNKFKKCQEKGIQLISIWEDQIVKYPDKVRTVILSKLGIYDERVYARNCTIKEVPSKECNVFLDNYHLQGKTNSSIRLGLYYNNELVSIMTFGKGRKCLNSKASYELYRYCCKAGIQIIGGASKLFKYFINKYSPESIESFSSNDISNGDLYKQLSFNCVSDSIGYWYVDRKMNRYHRYKFTKQELIKENFDPNKTEFEIMDERGFYRIYDSGQTKWIYTNSEK